MNITTKNQDGFIFTHVNKPDTEIVTIHLSANIYPTLSLNETAGLIVYSDLLLAGAGPYNRTEFLDKVNALGAAIGVDVSQGRVKITVDTLATKLPKVLALLKIMLTKPHFKASELSRAKKTILNQLELEKEQARAVAEGAFLRSLYPVNHRYHQYAPATIQTEIPNVTIKEISSLHQKFSHSAFVLTVGANTQNANLVYKTISALVKPLDKPDLKLVNSPAVLPPKKTLVTTDVPSYQNLEFSIGSNLPLNFSSTDLPAFYFALAVLGKWGGFAGRLMSTVREKEGLTYGIYARLENLTINETGHWRIMTFFAPKDCVQGITSVRREIEKIVKGGITDSELARFKNILQTGYKLMFDSLVQLTKTTHALQVSGLSFTDYQAFQAKLVNLSKKEVSVALKTYLDPETLTISVAGPTKSIQSTLKKVI